MVDAKSKIPSILLILCNWGSLGSLITNLKLDFPNSKWRIQYGEDQIEKSNNFSDTLYSVVFRVADYKFEIRFSKFESNMAVVKLKIHQFFRYLILGGFRIANYESEMRFLKFQMADP